MSTLLVSNSGCKIFSVSLTELHCISTASPASVQTNGQLIARINSIREKLINTLSYLTLS